MGAQWALNSPKWRFPARAVWACISSGENGCGEWGWTVSICGAVYTEEGVQLQNAKLGGSKDCVAYEGWNENGDYEFDETDRTLRTGSSVNFYSVNRRAKTAYSEQVIFTGLARIHARTGPAF